MAEAIQILTLTLILISWQVTAYRIKRLDFFKRVDNEALTALKTMVCPLAHCSMQSHAIQPPSSYGCHGKTSPLRCCDALWRCCHRQG